MQGNLSVQQFFVKVRDLMMDLILVRTTGQDIADAAETEQEVEELARVRFIEGLHTDLYAYTNSKNPETLNAALSVALEREALDNALKQAKEIEDPMMSMLQQIQTQLQYQSSSKNNNKGGRNNNRSFNKNNNQRRFDGSQRRCYNCNGFNHISRDCQKPRRNNDQTQNLVVPQQEPVYNVFASQYPQYPQFCQQNQPIYQSIQRPVQPLQVSYQPQFVQQQVPVQRDQQHPQFWQQQIPQVNTQSLNSNNYCTGSSSGVQQGGPQLVPTQGQKYLSNNVFNHQY